jgi:hypothetical protein
MAAKPESTFIRGVNKYLPETYFEKTNNPFRSGVADMWYSGIEGDLWVEYKNDPSLPKSREYLPKLSPMQVKWLGDRYYEGRNIAVILGLPEGGVIYRDLDWLKPYTRVQLLKRAMSRQDLAKWIFEQVGKSPCKSSDASVMPPKSSLPATGS